MLLTVDTSAVLAVAVGESTKSAIVEATRGADLIAPDSLPAEVGNALSAMYKRQRITLEQSIGVLAAVRAIPVRFHPIDLERALTLCDQLGIYAYDAYVLDCARATDAPLVTLDNGLRTAARQAGITIHPLDP
ncbi:MAG: type II toxin-antitoxin system VapC family toxin [Bacteroidota bacterium]